MSPVKALLALMAITVMVELVAAKNYTVGAPDGLWDLKTNYVKWTSNFSFHPNDTLLFTYSSQAHDLVEVTKDDFVSCSKGSPIKQYFDGNTSILLNVTGSRYFLCSISSHCEVGMKINVTVVSNSTST